MKLTAAGKMKCETDTVSMSRIVRSAAYDAALGHIGDLQTDFEHGQWWITNRRTGQQWSVCDAEGPRSAGVFNGFSFESVTEGDED